MKTLFEDCWIPVGLDGQLQTEAVHPIVVNGYGLALWRSLEGAIQIWEDRCPHRGMRLSFGFVRGDRLSCLYHGWGYEKSGQCGHIPAHPDLVPPKTICVPSYSVRSHRGIVFANLAEAPKADWPHAEEVGWRSVRSVFVAASVEAVRSYLGRTGNALGGAAGQGSLALCVVDAGATGKIACALQPIEAERTAIHISSTIEDVAARQQVALRATRMRRELELR